MNASMIILRVLLTGAGLWLLGQQIWHYSKGKAPGIEGLFYAVGFMGGLSIGFSVVVAAWIHHRDHPSRNILIVPFLAFVALSIIISIPATRQVYFADIYARIQKEKLGPDAELLTNLSNVGNNEVIELASMDIYSGVKMEDAKRRMKKAMADRKAHAMAVKNDEQAYESATEKALLGIEGAKLKGEEKIDFLFTKIRAEANRDAIGLEVLEKSLNGLNFALIGLGVMGAIRRRGDIMSPTRGKPQGSRQ